MPTKSPESSCEEITRNLIMLLNDPIAFAKDGAIENLLKNLPKDILKGIATNLAKTSPLICSEKHRIWATLYNRLYSDTPLPAGYSEFKILHGLSLLCDAAHENIIFSAKYIALTQQSLAEGYFPAAFALLHCLRKLAPHAVVLSRTALTNIGFPSDRSATADELADWSKELFFSSFKNFSSFGLPGLLLLSEAYRKFAKLYHHQRREPVARTLDEERNKILAQFKRIASKLDTPSIRFPQSFFPIFDRKGIPLDEAVILSKELDIITLPIRPRKTPIIKL